MQKLRTAARERVAEYIAEGRDVLDVAVELAFDKTLPPQLRLDAVAVAAPYIHPRLSAQIVEATTTHVHMSGGELAARTAMLLEQHNGAVGPTLEGEAEGEGGDAMCDGTGDDPGESALAGVVG